MLPYLWQHAARDSGRMLRAILSSQSCFEFWRRAQINQNASSCPYTTSPQDQHDRSVSMGPHSEGSKQHSRNVRRASNPRYRAMRPSDLLKAHREDRLLSKEGDDDFLPNTDPGTPSAPPADIQTRIERCSSVGELDKLLSSPSVQGLGPQHLAAALQQLGHLLSDPRVRKEDKATGWLGHRATHNGFPTAEVQQAERFLKWTVEWIEPALHMCNLSVFAQVMHACASVGGHSGSTAAWSVVKILDETFSHEPDLFFQATPADLATIAWSAARLGCTPPRLFEAMAAAAAAAATGLHTSEQLVQLVWAFARSGVRYRALGEAASAATCTLLSPHSRLIPEPEELALLCYAFGRLKWHRDEKLWQMLASAVMLVSDRISPHGLSSVVWGFATVEQVNLPLLKHLASGPIPSALAHMNPKSLVGTLWGYSKSGEEQPELFEAAVPHVLSNLEDMTHFGLTSTLWAYAQQRCYSKEVFDRACSLIVRDIDTGGSTMQGLATTAYTCAVVYHHPCDQLLDAISAHILGEQKPSMVAQDVTFLLWACAVLQYKNPLLLSHLLHLAAGFDAERLNNRAKMQLFQVNLELLDAPIMLADEAGASGAPLKLDDKVFAVASKFWLNSSRYHEMSILHSTVHNALLRMGLNPISHGMSKDGLFCADELVQMEDGMQVAVEVDGPTHFIRHLSLSRSKYVEGAAERHSIGLDAGWLDAGTTTGAHSPHALELTAGNLFPQGPEPGGAHPEEYGSPPGISGSNGHLKGSILAPTGSTQLKRRQMARRFMSVLTVTGPHWLALTTEKQQEAYLSNLLGGHIDLSNKVADQRVN